jgi:predicted transcriptional regulator
MTKLNADRVERIQLLLTLSRGAKSRRNILKSLLLIQKNCSQIARDVKLDWWTVQRHLRLLLIEDMVESSTFGNSKYYRLSQKSKETIRTISPDNKKEFDEQDHIDINSASGSHESRGKLYTFKLYTGLGLNWV